MKQTLRSFSLIIFFVLSSNTIFSNNSINIVKDTSWLIGGENRLDFSQVSVSNWAAGGENAISANGFLHLFANCKKGKYIWENELEIGYGLVKQGEASLRKSNDVLQLSSTYGQIVFKKWYLTASLDFRSQFSNGYKYPNDSTIISTFFAPAYILARLGLDYKPNKKFALSFAPISTRTTIVTHDSLSSAGAYGVEPGKKSRFEFMGTIKLFYKTKLMENVSFRTNLTLLSNYLHNPQNIDVNWEVYLNMRINKYLSANISTRLIYDDDIMIKNSEGIAAPRVQFKEMFGIGFSYKFQVN